LPSYNKLSQPKDLDNEAFKLMIPLILPMNKILLEINVFLLFLVTYVTLKFACRMEGKRKENKRGAKKKIVPSPLKRASTPNIWRQGFKVKLVLETT